MQVSPLDISVVIQGPLRRELAPLRGVRACVDSIRKCLPGAEIIVSTWKYEDTSDLDGCICVRLNEPPAFKDVSGREVNTNRQIVSTMSGIEAATRPYVLKFRADHLLDDAIITRIENYPDDIDPHDRLFTQPITLTNLFIRNPAKIPLLFHISDLVQFGTKIDMLDFWGQPIISRDVHFLPETSRHKLFGNFLGYTNLRLVPEQALMINWLALKGIEIYLSYPFEVRKDSLELWDSILRNNFRIIDWEEAAINFPKRFFKSGYPVTTVYTTAEIQEISNLGLTGKFIRRKRIWMNQFVIGCFKRVWILSAASILANKISPTLSKKLHSIWNNRRRLN
jgi:hypothetical protein